MNIETANADKIQSITELSRFIFEIANLVPVTNMPYVGESSFAHKGGLHIDALRKNKTTYEHIDPEMVGNHRRFLISELSGSANIMAKLENKNLTQNKELARKILTMVQGFENQGYQYEAAEASFDILIRKAMGTYKAGFSLDKYHVNTERNSEGKIMLFMP